MDQKKNLNDAKEFTELIKQSREYSHLFRLLSVALQSYIDGLKAASHCLLFSKTKADK